MSSMHKASADDGLATPDQVTRAIEQLGSARRLTLLREFESGPRRFDELKSSTGSGAHTLSRVLSDLREADIVDRHTAEDRATVYELTPKGESLAPVFEAVEAWAGEWCSIGDADGSE